VIFNIEDFLDLENVTANVIFTNPNGEISEHFGVDVVVSRLDDQYFSFSDPSLGSRSVTCIPHRLIQVLELYNKTENVT